MIIRAVGRRKSGIAPNNKITYPMTCRHVSNIFLFSFLAEGFKKGLMKEKQSDTKFPTTQWQGVSLFFPSLYSLPPTNPKTSDQSLSAQTLTLEVKTNNAMSKSASSESSSNRVEPTLQIASSSLSFSPTHFSLRPLTFTTSFLSLRPP